MIKFISTSILLFFIYQCDSYAYPNINFIKDNPDYLLIEENSLPIIDIRIGIKYGSRDDGARTGITNFAIKLLHKQEVDNSKLIHHFERIGAIYNSDVSRDSSYISVRLISTPENIHYVSKKLNILLKHQHITQDLIDDNKDIILNAINRGKLDPSSIIQNKANEIFFINTGYSHPIFGYKKDIRDLNIKEVRNYLDSIINKNSLEINIVGDINENSSANLISNLLSGIPQGKDTDKEKFILNYKKHRQVINIPHESKQTHIAIYIPSITRLNKDFYNILVANYIFGGSGFGSMLMKEIREEKGLAYSVYSYLAPYSDFGVLKISMQTETKNTSKAIEILKNQIIRFRNFNISRSSVGFAKIGLLRSFNLRFDTNKKMLENLSAINEYNMPENYFEHYVNGINNVTIRSIRESLNSRIMFDNNLIITVGNN